MSINKNSQKTPNLRFKGFTDDWEQRKLGEISKIKTGSSDLQDADATGKYPFFVRSENIERSNRFLFEGEAILIPGEGRLGEIYHYINGKFDYHQRVYKISNFSDYDVQGLFVLYYLKKNFKRHALKYTVKATVDSLRLPTLLEFNIMVPNNEEQQEIGSFLKQIDDTITLHQRKLDQLKQLKAALLQQMFPGKGETVPKLRFAGFEGYWEERKLGELGETKSGICFPDDEQGGKKGIPFFKVSDMNNIGNEHELKTSNNYVDTEQLKKRNWKPIMNVPAVIFAKVGAAIMLNRKRIVRMPFLLDNNTMAYIFDDSWNSDFGKILFETIYLPRYAQVGALPSYNGSDINNIKVFIPTNLQFKCNNNNKIKKDP